MKKKLSSCGIFATAFFATAMLTIVSCSKDDEYYDSDMYTLAEVPTTRSIGSPGEAEIPQINNTGFNAKECGVWCLARLYGNLNGIRRVIEEEHIDMRNGLLQKDMKRISDVLGFGITGWSNDTYLLDNKVVTEKGRAIKDLISIKGVGNVSNTIVFIPNHCSIATKVDSVKKIVYVYDVNPTVVDYTFSQIIGVMW